MKDNSNSNNNNNNNNMKQTWDCGSGCNVAEGDLLSGFPWPPRSYTCSFCKREFRSAQALGGHMNVHRRDRARLRQSPPRDGEYPLLNLNLKPNPNLLFNPNPSFSSSSPPSSSPFTKFPTFTSTLPYSLSPSPSTISSASSASATELKRFVKDGVMCNHFSLPNEVLTKKTTKALFGVEDLGSSKHEKRCTIMREAEIVTLDLEIGLFSEKKQDLDLELRLGYS